MNKKQDNLEYAKGYGKNYADLRKKEYNHVKDYTVRELADELFISASTISKIENEKVYPTVEQVKSYKKFFHVSLDYLTGETKAKQSDIQMICEYTGLSEKAIHTLVEFKKCQELDRLYNKEYHDKRFSKFQYTDTISCLLCDMHDNPGTVFSLAAALNYNNEEQLYNEGSYTSIDKFCELFPEAYQWSKDKLVIYTNHDNFNFIKIKLEKIFTRTLRRIIQKNNPADNDLDIYNDEYRNITDINEDQKIDK